MTLKRIESGVYLHIESGKMIFNTSGDFGPKGGYVPQWDIGKMSSNGSEVGAFPFRRLRDAVDWIESGRDDE